MLGQEQPVELPSFLPEKDRVSSKEVSACKWLRRWPGSRLLFDRCSYKVYLSLPAWRPLRGLLLDIPGTVPTLPSLGACDGVRLCERVSGRGRTGRRLGGAGGAGDGGAQGLRGTRDDPAVRPSTLCTSR